MPSGRLSSQAASGSSQGSRGCVSGTKQRSGKLKPLIHCSTYWDKDRSLKCYRQRRLSLGWDCDTIGGRDPHLSVFKCEVKACKRYIRRPQGSVVEYNCTESFKGGKDGRPHRFFEGGKHGRLRVPDETEGTLSGAGKDLYEHSQRGDGNETEQQGLVHVIDVEGVNGDAGFGTEMDVTYKAEDERAIDDPYNQFLDFNPTNPPWSGTHGSSVWEF